MRSRLGKKGLLGEDNRIEVVFEEHNRRYCANNPNRHRVLRYQIDGKLITRGERCDFAMGIPGNHTIFFIELKGADFKKAARQIRATIETLGEKLAGYVINGRVVLSRVSRPDLRSSCIIALERKLAESKGTLQKACNCLKETV
jgi:hypothetical protein